MNELEVLNKLVSVIREQLNNYIPDGYDRITDDHVDIDFPDVDRMRHPVMIYIQPDYAEYEGLTICSDEAEFRISVFIVVKRDTQHNLTLKSYAYFQALYTLCRENTDLDGTIKETKVNSVDFYPAFEGNLNVKGSEISLSTFFEKSF